jgi:hypothetical protein
MAITLEDLASVIGEQQKAFANLLNLVSSLHSISLELSARQAATEAVLAQLASLLLTWLSDDPARFLGELRSKLTGDEQLERLARAHLNRLVDQIEATRREFTAIPSYPN